MDLEKEFDELCYTSEYNGGFEVQYAGCDEPCCGGCARQLNTERIKAFLRSKITAAEQRGRNEVLEEIEKEVEELLVPELGYKDRPFFGTSAAIKFARVTNQTISEVRSIIQSHKV